MTKITKKENFMTKNIIIFDRILRVILALTVTILIVFKVITVVPAIILGILAGIFLIISPFLKTWQFYLLSFKGFLQDFLKTNLVRFYSLHLPFKISTKRVKTIKNNKLGGLYEYFCL